MLEQTEVDVLEHIERDIYTLAQFTSPEPTHPSWRATSAILQDALSIWLSEFPLENIDYFVEELQQASDELHSLNSP